MEKRVFLQLLLLSITWITAFGHEGSTQREAFYLDPTPQQTAPQATAQQSSGTSVLYRPQRRFSLSPRFRRALLYFLVFRNLLNPTTKPAATNQILQDTFADWHEHKGCRYNWYPFAETYDAAQAFCTGLHPNSGLIMRNIKLPADRQAIFGELVASLTWVGLTDADGTGASRPVWNDGTLFTSANGRNIYVNSNVRSCAYLGDIVQDSPMDAFIFDTCSLRRHFYICEYCPP